MLIIFFVFKIPGWNWWKLCPWYFNFFQKRICRNFFISRSLKCYLQKTCQRVQLHTMYLHILESYWIFEPHKQDASALLEKCPESLSKYKTSHLDIRVYYYKRFWSCNPTVLSVTFYINDSQAKYIPGTHGLSFSNPMQENGHILFLSHSLTSDINVFLSNFL